ncbi:unnamed protein product [Lupinus luteus]|uniref:Uncharacterized protein n=1 Tax=Lupinus luteus TaxID=3873 RepID=A0AAV1X7E2_LUPLU
MAYTRTTMKTMEMTENSKMIKVGSINLMKEEVPFMGQRLKVLLVGSDNVQQYRAVPRSLERFFGVLRENYAGNFPLWLSHCRERERTEIADNSASADQVNLSDSIYTLEMCMIGLDMEKELVFYKEHSRSSVVKTVDSGIRIILQYSKICDFEFGPCCYSKNFVEGMQTLKLCYDFTKMSLNKLVKRVLACFEPIGEKGFGMLPTY